MSKARIAGRLGAGSDNRLKALSGGIRLGRCASCQRLERRIASVSMLIGYVFVSCLSDDEAIAFARAAELNVEGFLRGRDAGRGKNSTRRRALRDALNSVKS
jgi:hypothetical protein